MRKPIIAAVALILCGCNADPVSTAGTTNVNIQVALLFEHEGVKVYRFTDGGRHIYYTDARGKTEWTTRHSNGKTTTTTHYEVETAD